MAENQTAAPWLLPYPSAVGKVKAGNTDFKELAERTTAILKEKNLIFKSYAAGATLKTGEMARQTKAGETFTLPAVATANQIIGATCLATNCKITTSGGAFIVGDFLTVAANVATITLTQGQHVVLQSDGERWWIIAGEPMQEQVYGTRTARALATPFTPSTSRPTFVVIDLSLEPTSGSGKRAEVYINGLLLTELFAGGHTVESGYRFSTSFIVPPGQSWEVRDGTGTGGVGSLHSSYLAQRVGP